mmetsp:Transcript_32513/g.58327  ORF Transcript_32513/g.58327 Transcript_32513/m.58327 type:complete len:152 (-) Transcript_32513:21-476(-)
MPAKAPEIIMAMGAEHSEANKERPLDPPTSGNVRASCQRRQLMLTSRKFLFRVRATGETHTPVRTTEVIQWSPRLATDDTCLKKPSPLSSRSNPKRLHAAMPEDLVCHTALVCVSYITQSPSSCNIICETHTRFQVSGAQGSTSALRAPFR